jgi:hypothetical protein
MWKIGCFAEAAPLPLMSDERMDRHSDWRYVMRKLTLSVLIFLALAAPAGAGTAPLVVAMHDPGCHWFSVGGKYALSVVRSGPVTLVNRDEAALRIKGPGGTKIERVGARLVLKASGTYRITMVAQAPDDNHLVLKIK